MLKENVTVISTAIELTTGGAVKPHVDTGGGGLTSELPWRGKYRDKYRPMKERWQLFAKNKDFVLSEWKVTFSK